MVDRSIVGKQSYLAATVYFEAGNLQVTSPNIACFLLLLKCAMLGAFAVAYIRSIFIFFSDPVHIILAQSVTCLVTDAKLTADPGVASSIPARSHTFVEIDHEIISTVILLSSAE